MSDLPIQLEISRTGKILLLDERGARTLRDPKSRFYFLGGISLSEDQLMKLAKSVREFKQHLHPGTDVNSWELKGASSSIGKNDVENARRKWKLWAAFLDRLEVAYTIHGCFIILESFCRNYCDGNHEILERSVIEKAFSTVVARYASTSLVRVSSLPYNQPEVELVEITPTKIVHDCVDGLQKEASETAIQKVASKIPFLAGHAGLTILPSEDVSTDEAVAMQFVDMQIYALTRYCAPSVDTKNILVDFEQYPRDFLSGEVHAYAELPDRGRSIVERFYHLAPIFHHIRHRIRKGWFDRQGNSISTVALIDDDVHENFGAHVDHAMWNFCNGQFDFYRSDFFSKING